MSNYLNTMYMDSIMGKSVGILTYTLLFTDNHNHNNNDNRFEIKDERILLKLHSPIFFYLGHNNGSPLEKCLDVLERCFL